MAFSARLADAFAFANRVHEGQLRKGSRVPYITHPMAVAAMVGEDGGTETEVIAALLHDCVEDGAGLQTLADIRAEFGDEVAEIVWACSDAHEQPKPPWRERKEAFITALRGAPPSVKRVVTADKMHNAGALRALLRERGADAWKVFRGGRDGTMWYYPAIIDALGTGWDAGSLDALREEVGRLQETAAKL